jgi:hypothetical protein|tara:strand:+ start:195 stop:467 length:273 start_codon:yes stop_codon:yes gene_type:complete
MGYNDKLVRRKDGSYILKSKSKNTKENKECLECRENPSVRNLMFQYNTEDMILVRNHIENHLFMHPKHKSVTPEWCDACKAFKGYVVKIV